MDDSKIKTNIEKNNKQRLAKKIVKEQKRL